MLCVLHCALVSWSWLRIPGVLQRLGFTYFVLSLLQTFWGQKEIPLTAVSSSVKFSYFSHYTQEKKLKESNLKKHTNNKSKSRWTCEFSAVEVFVEQFNKFHPFVTCGAQIFVQINRQTSLKLQEELKMFSNYEFVVYSSGPIYPKT